MSEFDRLREVAAKATPGRWKLWGMSVMADQDGTSDVDTAVYVASTHYLDENSKPRTWDAKWVVLSQPAEVLALLDRLEAAEVALARVRSLLDGALMVPQAEVRRALEGAQASQNRDLTASEVENDSECHRNNEGRFGARDGSGYV